MAPRGPGHLRGPSREQQLERRRRRRALPFSGSDLVSEVDIGRTIFHSLPAGGTAIGARLYYSTTTLCAVLYCTVHVILHCTSGLRQACDSDK